VQVAQDVPTPRARPTISAASRERASEGQPHAFGLFCLPVALNRDRSTIVGRCKRRVRIAARSASKLRLPPLFSLLARYSFFLFAKV